MAIVVKQVCKISDLLIDIPPARLPGLFEQTDLAQFATIPLRDDRRQNRFVEQQQSRVGEVDRWHLLIKCAGRICEHSVGDSNEIADQRVCLIGVFVPNKANIDGLIHVINGDCDNPWW